MGPISEGAVFVACIGLTVLLAGPGEAQQQESFNTRPPPLRSRFSCSGRRAGYYADAESNCRAYHTCDEHGNHFTHYCPEDTAFRQDAMICDHAYQVDCAAGTTASVGFAVGALINSVSNEPRGESSNGFVSSFKPEAETSPTSDRREADVGDAGGFQETAFPRRDGGQLAKTTVPTGPQQRVDNNLLRSGTSPPTQSRITPPPRSSFAPSTPPPTPSISLELLPPAESPITFQQYQPEPETDDQDEYSFLAPPPIRTDNDFLREGNLTSSSYPSQSVTPPQSPRSRSIDPSPVPIKPSHLLQPPHLEFNPVPESPRPVNRADDFAYAETLRSIQSSSSSESPFARTTTTTTTTARAEIFGVPHAVLLPPENTEAEVDPYYPREEGSTEAYFTPSGRPQFGSTTPTRRRPAQQQYQQGTGTASKFHVPPVLPDFNSLDDLLDRRKLFFIPTLKAGA